MAANKQQSQVDDQTEEMPSQTLQNVSGCVLIGVVDYVPVDVLFGNRHFPANCRISDQPSPSSPHQPVFCYCADKQQHRMTLPKCVVCVLLSKVNCWGHFLHAMFAFAPWNHRH